MNGYIVTLLMGLLLGGMVLNTTSNNTADSFDTGFHASSHTLALGSERSEVSYAMDMSRESYAASAYGTTTASFST